MLALSFNVVSLLSHPAHPRNHYRAHSIRLWSRARRLGGSGQPRSDDNSRGRVPAIRTHKHVSHVPTCDVWKRFFLNAEKPIKWKRPHTHTHMCEIGNDPTLPPSRPTFTPTHRQRGNIMCADADPAQGGIFARNGVCLGWHFEALFSIVHSH